MQAKHTFFTKKVTKIWLFPKKAVPLHTISQHFAQINVYIDNYSFYYFKL